MSLLGRRRRLLSRPALARQGAGRYRHAVDMRAGARLDEADCNRFRHIITLTTCRAISRYFLYLAREMTPATRLR